jgi:hypothetical protein
VKAFRDKPFALLGVNSDADREMVKQVAQEQGLTWRSWWDGSTTGPIDTRWQIEGWPSLFVIDAKGIIRFRPESLGADAGLVERRVEQLLKEMGP